MPDWYGWPRRRRGVGKRCRLGVKSPTTASRHCRATRRSCPSSARNGVTTEHFARPPPRRRRGMRLSTTCWCFRSGRACRVLFRVVDATEAERSQVLAFLEDFKSRAKGLSTCVVMSLAADAGWISVAAKLVKIVSFSPLSTKMPSAHCRFRLLPTRGRHGTRDRMQGGRPGKIVLGVFNGGVKWTTGEARPRAITFLEAARLSGYYDNPSGSIPTSELSSGIW